MTPEQFIEWKKNMTDIYMPSPYLDQILEWSQEEYKSFIENLVEECKQKWDCVPFSKLCKKRGKNFVFVTLNFNEKVITKGTPLQIVNKITSWQCVKKYAYSFEWRDHEAETGLHAHLILVGECKRITVNCKRLKGPFIELNEQYKTLLKYPMKYLQDKVDYISGKTFEETKNDHKSKDEELRIKHNLLSFNNI